MNFFYRRILLVEDDATSQLLMSKILDKMGYDFDVTTNGDDAIEHINFVKYELVIMDVYMPIMNGFELCDYIRAHANYSISSMKIIGMSADPNVKDLCISKGMNYFFEKPFDLHQVKSLIELCLTTFK